MPLTLKVAMRMVLGFKAAGKGFEIATSDGRYLIKPYAPNIVETSFVPSAEEGKPQAASHAVVLTPAQVPVKVQEDGARIVLATEGITVTVEKSPFRIGYSYKGKPLVAEKRGYGHRQAGVDRIRGRWRRSLYGAGSRAVGMNRRGYRFPLYNKASYGFGSHAEQMGYGIPMALSSKRYAIHFDNPQAGYLDLDSRKDGTLRFEAIGGPKTYQVVAGDDWAQIMDGYTRLTGRQPLPPRWAFGNFASRFGYHTRLETRAVVDKFIADGIPLDAVVLDLYWFGKTVKGTMGNLAWDRDSFPHAEKMMADFKQKGVQTVLITEPFILTTSKRWKDAAQQGVLATGQGRQALHLRFLFREHRPGRRLQAAGARLVLEHLQGAEGGRRGRLVGRPGRTGDASGRGPACRGQRRPGPQYLRPRVGAPDPRRLCARLPAERPFILMRSGYSGSQRFGMIPWSGDVSRGWGGLQSQMEISLQMGMQGQAYMHSDLGGFAGPVLDDELYVRWLQYGVFQPVFRPHAQEDVAPSRCSASRRPRRWRARRCACAMPCCRITTRSPSRTAAPACR
jgi:oligosaccharide 4-alpha-D-glucosyltransferase